LQTWQDTSEKPYRFSVEMKLHLRDSCRNPLPPTTTQPGDDFQVLDNLSTPLLIRYSELAWILPALWETHKVPKDLNFFLNFNFTFSLALLPHTSYTVSELQPGSQMVVIASLLSHPQEKRY